MGVLDILRSRGNVSLSELNLRIDASPAELLRELSILVEDGLVAVDGLGDDGQQSKAELIGHLEKMLGAMAGPTVRLTKCGLRRAFA